MVKILIYRWTDFDAGAYLSKNNWKSGDDRYKANKFNLEASDKAKFDRPVPDTRESQCRKIEWKTDGLPETSIIITFHNEGQFFL